MTLPEKISADYTLRPSELAEVLALLGRGPPGDHNLGATRGGEKSDQPAGRRSRQPPVRRRPGASARPCRPARHPLARRRRTVRAGRHRPSCRRPTIPAAGSSNLEELPSAVPMVQAALYQLVLERKVGEYELPERASLIACGNRETDRGVVHGMPTPLASRFVHLDIRVDAEDWCNWGAANGMAPEVLFFITYEPDLLHQFDPQSKERAFPCP